MFLEAPTRAIVFVFVKMRRIISSSLRNDPDILENLAEFPTAKEMKVLHFMFYLSIFHIFVTPLCVCCAYLEGVEWNGGKPTNKLRGDILPLHTVFWSLFFR